MGRKQSWIRRRREGEKGIGGGEGGEADPEAPDFEDRLWLVLGGGGLKGLAHVGAWRAMRECGLRVEGILGTSIGALVGMGIAAGLEPDELAKRARSLRRRDIVRFQRRALWVNGVRSQSVFRGEVLRDYLQGVLPVRSWDDLRIPLQVNAVELGTGETEWFGTGARTDVDPVDAVYASAALPVFYPPASVGGGVYVDGGTAEALALRRARELGATGILAVDVGAGPTENAQRVVEAGMVAIHQRVFQIQSGAARRALLEGWTSPPLLVIRPELDGYRTFDFEHVEYFLEEGYRAAREVLARAPALAGGLAGGDPAREDGRPGE